MNLFKKAIVASAIVASFGASATATLSSDPLELSAQGIAAGNTAANVVTDIDFVLGTLTPSASVITLTFDETVDLSDLETALGTNTAVTDDAPAANQGQTAGGEIIFTYGNGSFTFDKLVVDTSGDNHTVTFEVNLGDPILADSAFRMTFAAPAGVDISGAANVAYRSVNASDVEIETGSGVIATEVTQYTAAVSSDFDGIIERVVQQTFTGTATTTDAAVLSLTNDETLAAAITVTDIEVVVEGNFDNGATGAAALVATDFAIAGQAAGAGAYAFNADLDELTIDTFTVLATGAADPITITYTQAGADVIPVTGDITAEVTFTDGADPTTLEVTGLGEWKLDATVINVPYFPVGFEGTSTSVHFANEVATDADVIVTAIDGEGNEYGPLDLGMDLAGDTVTKVSQTTIMNLFSLTDSAKLSVTFNIDADEGDVNAYAFTSSEVGRTEISNSQLKGK
jgi:hypothetical protein